MTFLDTGPHLPQLVPVVDYLFKFLVIGSAGVGKSCILHQFIEGKCKVSMRLTQGPTGKH